MIASTLWEAFVHVGLKSESESSRMTFPKFLRPKFSPVTRIGFKFLINKIVAGLRTNYVTVTLHWELKTGFITCDSLHLWAEFYMIVSEERLAVFVVCTIHLSDCLQQLSLLTISTDRWIWPPLELWPRAIDFLSLSSAELATDLDWGRAANDSHFTAKTLQHKETLANTVRNALPARSGPFRAEMSERRKSLGGNRLTMRQ